MVETEAKLATLRGDLEVLNMLQLVVGEARVPAKEHEKAAQVLGWLEVRIKAAEAELAILLPPSEPEPEPTIARVNGQAA